MPKQQPLLDSLTGLPAMRIRLVAEDPGIQQPIIRSPKEAAGLLYRRMIWEPSEALWVLALSTRNRVVAAVELYRGSLNSCHVRVGEIMRIALLCNAAAVIIVHNHPSGDPTPSPEDVRLTRQIIEAGKLLGIEVLDHLVIGRHEGFPEMAPRYASLKEGGYV